MREDDKNIIDRTMNQAGREQRKSAGFVALLVVGAAFPVAVLIEAAKDQKIQKKVREQLNTLIDTAGSAANVTVATGKKAVTSVLELFQKPEQIEASDPDDDNSEDHAVDRVSAEPPENNPDSPPVN